MGRASVSSVGHRTPHSSSESLEHNSYGERIAMGRTSVSSVGRRTPHSSSGDSEKHESLVDMTQTDLDDITFSSKDENMSLEDMKTVEVDKGKEDTVKEVSGDQLHFAETHADFEDAKEITHNILAEESVAQEVKLERKTSIKVATVKDMSGMESLLTRDLDRYLDEQPIVTSSQPEEETIIQERFEQIILAKGHKPEMMTSSDVKSMEPVLQEVKIERKTSIPATTVKDMSGMASLLTGDLEHYLEKQPVVAACQPEEDTIELEKFEQVFLTRGRKQETLTLYTDEENMLEENMEGEWKDYAFSREEEHMQTGTYSSNSDSEDLTVHLQKSSKTVPTTHGSEHDTHMASTTALKDWHTSEVRESLDVIHTDLDNQDSILTDQACAEASQKTLEVHESKSDKSIAETHADFEDAKEITHNILAEESVAQEVKLERKTFIKASTVKDMSGIESLLTGDLDRYLDEQPVVTSSQPEDETIIQERFEQIILAKGHKPDMMTSSDVKSMEPVIQEVKLERKTSIPATTVKDMSGMASLLTGDLEHYLEKQPVVAACQPEEDTIELEKFEQVFLTRGRKQETLTLYTDEENMLKENMEGEWKDYAFSREEEHMQTGTYSSNSDSEDLTVHLQKSSKTVPTTHGSEHDTHMASTTALKDWHTSEVRESLHVIHTDLDNQDSILTDQACAEASQKTLEVHESKSDKSIAETHADFEDAKEITYNILAEESVAQEVKLERKTSIKGSTVKDMSGMESLLTGDLDRYLDEQPVVTSSQPEEETIIQERLEQIILPKGHKPEIVTSSDVKSMEPVIQEVKLERKTSIPATTMKDMSGMASLLTGDLEHYLEKQPVVAACQPEEDTIELEKFEQVFLTRGCKQETLTLYTYEENMLEENTEKGTVNQVHDMEGEWKDYAFSREEEHMQTGTYSSNSDSEDLTVHLQKSSKTVPTTHGSEHDTHMASTTALKDWHTSEVRESLDVIHTDLDNQDLILTHQACAEASQKTLEVHESKSDKSIERGLVYGPDYLGLPIRPLDLETSHTVPMDDLERCPSHRDSLENSPNIEDRSSNKSPDSIDPSPTGDSPCPDSLEGSPTEPKPYTARPIFQENDQDTPRKAAVYEDYASQLKACYAYDRSIYEEEGDDQLVHGIEIDGVQEDDEAAQRQITPEEEMFKMATKIKTFEEMDEEDKIRKGSKFSGASFLSETGEYEEGMYTDSIPTDREAEEVYLRESNAHDVEHFSGMQPSSPHVDDESKGPGYCDTTLFARVSIDSQTACQTNDDLIKKKETFSTEDLSEDVMDNTKEMGSTEREDKHDQSQLSVSLSDERVSDSQPSCGNKYEKVDKEQGDSEVAYKPEMCIDEHRREGAYGEKDILEMQSDEMTVCGELVPWSSLTDCTEEEEEDDEAFNARVEAEEQRILGIAAELRTPDTTPGRTPTEEGTPSPFQFQEGKLFEMTRGGAIDMTRRSCEEGEGFEFFHIGDHPVDVIAGEDARVGQTKDLSESPLPSTPLAVESTSPPAEVAHIKIPVPMPRGLCRTEPSDSADVPASGNPLLKAGMPSSTDSHLGSPDRYVWDPQKDITIPTELEFGYLDSTIADLQTATSTVTRSVYSDQTLDSSESSPEDEEEEEEEDLCSVIEVPTAAEAKVSPSSVSAASDISADFQESPPPLSSNQHSTTKETGKFKSKIPLKTGSMKYTQEQSSDQERRTRSEADVKTCKDVGKDSRSLSDRDNPSGKSTPLPSRLPVKQKQSACFSSQADGDQLSDVPEPSVRSAVYTDVSSADPKSPHSVIFKYDSPISFSSDPKTRLPLGARPSSVTEDVFESRPIWDDTVETQMQRIVDDQTPEQHQVDWQDDADRKEETLAIIADLLGFSWTELARELEFSEDEMQQVRTENPNSLQEQSQALLQRWAQREGKHATEDGLIKRLTKINRMDIVHLIETQMNKSVQEQTSRTYAEIEKTLDHSEVSVALSLVQEDVDSPRLVRMVESDRRPPPAVSEEDLSVASLLDIPSWSEPMGHTHSESMHCDLLEELEIPHELNPNVWTSEDVMTQESKALDNIDEQVPTDYPMKDLSESSEHEHVVLEHSTTDEIPSMSLKLRNILPSEALELRDFSQEPSPLTVEGSRLSQEGHRKPSKQSRDSSTSSSPSHTPVIPDLLSHMSQDSSDLGEDLPTSESVSPKLDQLLSELEDIKSKFRPETLLPIDPLASESSEDSPEILQPYIEFKDLSPEDDRQFCEGEKASIHLAETPTEAELLTLGDPSQSHVTEPQVFRITPDLIKTSTEPTQVLADPVYFSDLSPLASMLTHRAVNCDISGSSADTTINSKSDRIPESSEKCCEAQEMCSEFNVQIQEFQTLRHDVPTGDASSDLWTDSAATDELTVPEHKHEVLEDEYIKPVSVEKSNIERCQVFNEVEDSTDEQSNVGSYNPTQKTQELSILRIKSPPETNQYQEPFPKPVSVTAEAVTDYRLFNLEELTPFSSPNCDNTSSKEVKVKVNSEGTSSDSTTPVDMDPPSTQTSSAKPGVQTLSTQDEDLSVELSVSPQYNETYASPSNQYKPKPPMYVDIVQGSMHKEDSDTESYFDCKQAFSDFSENERDEPKKRSNLSQAGSQPGRLCDQQRKHPKGTVRFSLGRPECGSLLSSGSEDFDDVQEPPDEPSKVTQELSHTEESFFEASQELPVGQTPFCDQEDSMWREMAADIDATSESSDEDFLTTRVVRRKVIIKADEMPDLPPQTVTEEHYTDEHGHMVVKKVTRKIIRKCVSADGMEREEVTVEGSPQGSVSVAEGDSYSRVVKRTVLRSEGDHTEVTFTDGVPGSGEELLGGHKVSRVEQTSVVEGERRETHHGDPSLTSDLPSAREDFSMGPDA
ncbi:ankyrin-2 isoform X2 [Hypomesus transpacificus]|uniref:ankyrin-2 isoform X2 n=1 Tax=Hypomesus transpacificus TaxID=137520 RepID=UPI001F07FE11|nr:ankyrin-2 isoform X2 [Hypomesus transpacificus]